MREQDGRWKFRHTGLAVGVAALLGTVVAMDGFGAEVERTVPVRLMAYNAGSAANLPLGPRQIDQIARTIIDNAVDVAGLCEMELGTAWHNHRDHVAELCDALARHGYPMHSYRWPAIQLQGGWQTPCLLSRFPIEESAYEVIPPPGGFRWCVGHITVSPAQNTPFRVHMTHFWPQGDFKAQVESVRRLVSIHKTFDGPSAIMGDFNMGPESRLYEVVREQGWRNACEVLRGQPCPTVHGQAGVSGPLPLRSQIDYVFGNQQIEFSDVYVGYFSMSDHWPVVAEIRIRAHGSSIPVSLPDSSAASPAGAARARVMAHYRRGRYAEAAKACTGWKREAADPDEQGFAAYTAACMAVLGGRQDQGMDALNEVLRGFSGTEWAVRAQLRRSFLLRDAGRWQEAEDALMGYLTGYYAIIHPDDPKVITVKVAAEQIAACRIGYGREASEAQVLEELAEAGPQSMVGRAAAFELYRRAWAGGDKKGAMGHLRRADPPLTGRLWDHEARDIAECYRQMGEVDKAEQFYRNYLESFTDPMHRRVRAARWNKRCRPDEYMVQVPTVKGIRIDGDLSDWSDKPLVRLAGPEHTVVINTLAPSQIFAADVYIGRQDHGLTIALNVADDDHHNPHAGQDLYRGDGVQISVDPKADGGRGYGEDDFEFGVALTPRGVKLTTWYDRQNRKLEQIQAAVIHDMGRTRYELLIPWSVIGPSGSGNAELDKIGLDVLVGYADGKERLGWLDWTPGIGEEKAPELYPTLILKP